MIKTISLQSPTNIWITGVSDTVEIISTELERLLDAIDSGSEYTAVGVSLPGLEEGTEMMNTFKEKMSASLIAHKLITKKTQLGCYNDSLGGPFTVSPNGGIVLILGTGSMCRFLSLETDLRVGGWGHIIGDMASAYWLVIEAIKRSWHTADGLTMTEYDVAPIFTEIMRFFNLKDRNDIYSVVCDPRSFSKDHVASFAVKIAELANSGDEFALALFEEAGIHAANHIGAIVRKALKANPQQREFVVVAVGSVWKSYHLFKHAMMDKLSSFHLNVKLEFKILEYSSALGTGWYAAYKATGKEYKLIRDEGIAFTSLDKSFA